MWRRQDFSCPYIIFFLSVHNIFPVRTYYLSLILMVHDPFCLYNVQCTCYVWNGTWYHLSVHVMFRMVHGTTCLYMLCLEWYMVPPVCTCCSSLCTSTQGYKLRKYWRFHHSRLPGKCLRTLCTDITNKRISSLI